MATMKKTELVAKYIRSKIHKGIWSAGTKLPSPVEISEEMGASPNTVRNTLAMLASEGLVERRKKAGTFVSDSSTMGTVVILGRTEVLVSNEGYYYKSLVAHAKECIEAKGYRAVLVSGHGDTPETFYNSINLLEKPFTNNVVGILSLIELQELDDRIAKAGLNVVSIVPSNSSDHHSVVLDYRRMTELAVQELKANGFDDFAIMYSDSEFIVDGKFFETEAIRMYRDIVGDDESRLIPVKFSYDLRHAREAFKQYWARPDHSRAIFFAEDAVLDVASRAFAELGLSIPEDISIITHANVGRYFHLPCSVTRIEFDPRQLVVVAMGMLESLISGELTGDKVVRVVPKIKQGDSVRKSAQECMACK